MTLGSMFKVKYTKKKYDLLRDLFLHYDGLFIIDKMNAYMVYRWQQKIGIANINLGVKFSPRVSIFGTIVSYDV